MTDRTPHAVVSHVVVFGRVLREGGLEVGPGRIGDALRGLDRIDLARQDDVYWTLRQTLVSRREDLEIFDRAFDAWFLRLPGARRLHELDQPPRPGERRKGGVPGPGPEVDGGELEVGAWSGDELLRTRDFAAMTPEEFVRARSLIRAVALDRPRRRTHRLRPDRRGATLDVRALVRRSLATGGDPVAHTFRSRGTAPRKLVLLLDVSGSMEAYSRALLLYLHAARGSGRGVETFAFGTRLTRLTSELATRDPDAALEAAASRVLDWAGGTRIGASLKAYNDEWGRRALTRGAVVVVLSDGCERGDAAVVRDEVRRLARQAFAVVWVNPLKAHPDYEPLTAGMAAALPYVDRLVSGHDVASLETLGSVLRGIERRHQACR
ncbi:MAG: vWA domain-containing protein [Gaiellaceae bacterium]